MTTPLKYTDVMKPEDISVAHCWTIFAGVVLEPGASQVQRDEMRKSFYAGFVECFKIMSDVTDELTEEQAAVVLERLHGEGHEFYKKMVADYGKKP